MDSRQQPNQTEENSSTNSNGTNNETTRSSRRRPTPYDRPHIRQPQNTNSSSINNMNVRAISARRQSTPFGLPIIWETDFSLMNATSAANVIESTSGANTSQFSADAGSSDPTFSADTRAFSFGDGISTSPSGASTRISTIGVGSNASLFGAGSNASSFGVDSDPSLYSATTRTFPSVTSDSFLGAGSSVPAFAAGTSANNSSVRSRINSNSSSASHNINTLELDSATRPRQSPYDRNPILHFGNAPHLGSNMRLNNDGDPERSLHARRSVYTPLRIAYNQLPQRVEPERLIGQNLEDLLLYRLNQVFPPHTRRPSTARNVWNVDAREQSSPNDHDNDRASRSSTTNDVVDAVARVQLPPSPDGEDENMDIEPDPSGS